MPFCYVTLKAARPLPPWYPSQLQTIGDHVRQKRTDIDLLQRELGAQLAVDKTTVSHWERNLTTPTLQHWPSILLFHDGDSNHLPETFRTAMDGAPPLDLAVVGDWFPFSVEGKLILDEILRSHFVGLGHRPLDPGTLTADSFAALGDTYFLFEHPGERWEIPPS